MTKLTEQTRYLLETALSVAPNISASNAWWAISDSNQIGENLLEGGPIAVNWDNYWSTVTAHRSLSGRGKEWAFHLIYLHQDVFSCHCHRGYTSYAASSFCWRLWSSQTFRCMGKCNRRLCNLESCSMSKIPKTFSNQHNNLHQLLLSYLVKRSNDFVDIRSWDFHLQSMQIVSNK